MACLAVPPDGRLLWMDYPLGERVHTLVAELEHRHADHYMVWNVAGNSSSHYDPSPFGGRVVQLRFTGFLCPPLMMLLEACASIHAWLRADAANVVAVHCRSGRGRSAVLLCCVLAWRAAHGCIAGPTSPLDWLAHLAHLRREDETSLALPTHRRYLFYVGEILSGLRPASCGRLLQGIVLHSFPQMSPPPTIELHCGEGILYRRRPAFPEDAHARMQLHCPLSLMIHTTRHRLRRRGEQRRYQAVSISTYAATPHQHQHDLHCPPRHALTPPPPSTSLPSSAGEVTVLPAGPDQPEDTRSYLYETGGYAADAAAAPSPVVLREDAVLTVRTADGERMLLFRVGFHPDLTPSLRLQRTEMAPQHGNLLRLAHSALDGASECLSLASFVDITLAPLPITMDSEPQRSELWKTADVLCRVNGQWKAVQQPLPVFSVEEEGDEGAPEAAVETAAPLELVGVYQRAAPPPRPSPSFPPPPAFKGKPTEAVPMSTATPPSSADAKEETGGGKGGGKEEGKGEGKGARGREGMEGGKGEGQEGGEGDSREGGTGCGGERQDGGGVESGEVAASPSLAPSCAGEADFTGGAAGGGAATAAAPGGEEQKAALPLGDLHKAEAREGKAEEAMKGGARLEEDCKERADGDGVARAAGRAGQEGKGSTSAKLSGGAGGGEGEAAGAASASETDTLHALEAAIADELDGDELDAQGNGEEDEALGGLDLAGLDDELEELLS